MFYGFEYWEGTHTTTGGRKDRKIAGSLHAFGRLYELNLWLSQGVDHYSLADDHDSLPFRRRVFSSKLPLGWKTKDVTCASCGSGNTKVVFSILHGVDAMLCESCGASY